MTENNTSLIGELRVTQRLSEYEYGVSLRIMREGVNRNHWDYRNLEKYYLTFLGQPILVAYVNGGTVVGDGHNMKLRRDPNTGEAYYSFTDGTAERIVGTISDDPKDLTVVENDGHKWLEAKGRIFAFYAKELVDEIIQTGVFEVSAETDVKDSYTEGNIEVFTEWAGLGVTILGKGVAPAIQGARIEALAALEEEFTELKLKAASYCEKGNSHKEVIKENKGVSKTVKIFTKKQVAELSAKIDGYSVLAAQQDENGIYLALLSDDGTPAMYTMRAENEPFVAENAVKDNITVVYKFNEENECFVEPGDITDMLSAKIVRNNATIEKLQNDLEEANDKLATMANAECKRRVQAAKNAATRQLAEINANRSIGEAFAEDIIAPVLNSADNGEFTNIVNADGEWEGEIRAMSMVRDIAMTKQMELDKAKADSHKKKYIFENGFNGNDAGDGSIESLYSAITAQ